MGASKVHEVLVVHLVDEIQNSYGLEMDLFLRTECSLLEQYPIPPIIDNYRPDVFAEEVNGSLVIIGEAKTPKDLETARSLQQIISFINYLERTGNGVMLLAVPWHAVPTAKNILRSINNKFNIVNVSFSVLEKLPG